MSTLYTNILDKNRLKTYSKLDKFADEFVLSGGTALMLQINHRESYDFDCFTKKPLEKSLLRKVKNVFGKDINIRIDSQDLLLFTTPNGVKVDFVYYPYPPLHPLIKNHPISLFSIADIASNKAYTIGRRATWRDYVDLFFLLKKSFTTLEKVIADANKRFAGEFNEKLFLEQLVYFDDLEVVFTKFLQEKYTENQIKKFLIKTVKDHTTSILD